MGDDVNCQASCDETAGAVAYVSGVGPTDKLVSLLAYILLCILHIMYQAQRSTNP